MMARISPLAAALTALTLAGCAIGPDYQRPSAALPASRLSGASSASSAGPPDRTAAMWSMYSVMALYAP